MATITELQDIATQVRRDIIRMTNSVSSGHPGGSLGCADVMTALYFEILNLDVENFKREGHGEDMFFLSNGHISPVLYSVLARRGYFPVAELATFRRLGTRLQGHPSVHDNLPGVRQASGSLGQGLSVGIGAALAKKYNSCDKLVFTLHGDGELQEGQNLGILYGTEFSQCFETDNTSGIISPAFLTMIVSPIPMPFDVIKSSL